ncbi:MAG: iron-containing alcohol dehydrogenase [Bacillota bacterium]
MLNFDFLNSTRLIFGQDRHKEIGSLLKPHTKKVLLHYGSGSIKRNGIYQAVIASLQENEVGYVELGGVKPNPRLKLVYEAIELCKREQVDFILAVGGGSVIDSAKAIAMGVLNKGDVWDYYITRKELKGVLPIATILTIPAAGSESSPNTVITNEEQELKLGYGNDKLRPLFSVVNPELFITLPPNQIANGVADMMSHIMERYFTNTLHTDLIDGLCESALKTIMKQALILKKDPKNYNAWAEIALAGNVAHNGLLGLGRMGDWACHAIEHELSAIYDVAHGAGLAVITPAWMKYVYQTNIAMFMQFAVNVMGVEGSYREPEALILEGIERLKDFFIRMGLSVTLTELGIDDENFELMARKATGLNRGKEHLIGGLKKLNSEDVLAIYTLAK